MPLARLLRVTRRLDELLLKPRNSLSTRASTRGSARHDERRRLRGRVVRRRRDAGCVPQRRAGLERPQPRGSRSASRARRSCSRTSATSTGSAVQQTNCHPFRHGRWLWMHNGLIGEFPTVKREIAFAVDPVAVPGDRGLDRLRALLLPCVDVRARGRPARRGRARGRPHRGDRAPHGVEQPIQMTVATTDGDAHVGVPLLERREVRGRCSTARTSRHCGAVSGQPGPAPALRRTRGWSSPSRSATSPAPGTRSPRPPSRSSNSGTRSYGRSRPLPSRRRARARVRLEQRRERGKHRCPGMLFQAGRR